MRLGGTVLPAFPPSFALTSRATAAGLTVPAGGVLLCPDLGPVRPGELVDLRTAGLRDRPAAPLTVDEAAELLRRTWAGEALLLTRAVLAVHGGTALLRPGLPYDDVSAFEVTPEGRAAGQPARPLLVPRLGRRQRPHRGGDTWRTPLPPWGMRLAALLRAVRPLADGGIVEWSDDGSRCWLLLAHPAD